MTDFYGLGVAKPILQALDKEGYATPTPIQTQAIPPLLEGKDLLGVAQTGTGKTAAFAIPLLQRLSEAKRWAEPRKPQGLILAPTRELAAQIGDSLRLYGNHLRLRRAVVFGGTAIMPQIKALKSGVHLLVATPGRLMDLKRQGAVSFDGVDFFVLDEADRMLDMGFIHDVKAVAGELPKTHQTAFFSATMPKAVAELASGLLRDPVRVDIAPAATTAERVEQHLLYVSKANKRPLLSELFADPKLERVLVFTRTKHGADRLADFLVKRGIEADSIHGDKKQSARQRALRNFAAGKFRALVATDVAARGIDVEGITHVINFEMPVDVDNYVHRIGRTARGQASGVAISLCDETEGNLLRDIERVIRQTLPVFEDHPFHEAGLAKSSKATKGKGPRSGGARSGGPGGGPGGARKASRPGQRRRKAVANSDSPQRHEGQPRSGKTWQGKGGRRKAA